MAAKFITLEGVDGAGKSSHTDWLVEQLQARQIPVIATREPGGTALGERLRELLLHEPMSLETETLLMFAARMEHLQQVIIPHLQQGTWVICDRFTDATYAYQGGGRQLAQSKIASLEAWVHEGLQPDITLFFDVPLDVAKERLLKSRQLDRFEQESSEFFTRTQAAYHQRLQAFPERFVGIDGTLTIEQIRCHLAQCLDHWTATS